MRRRRLRQRCGWHHDRRLRSVEHPHRCRDSRAVAGGARLASRYLQHRSRDRSI